jgi:hypothetical protein
MSVWSWWGKLPEGSPIVAVISGNLNPTKCMAHEHLDSGALAGLFAAFFGARPAGKSGTT